MREVIPPEEILLYSIVRIRVANGQPWESYEFTCLLFNYLPAERSVLSNKATSPIVYQADCEEDDDTLPPKDWRTWWIEPKDIIEIIERHTLAEKLQEDKEWSDRTEREYQEAVKRKKLRGQQEMDL